jgi:hypothetical protein
LSPLQNDSLIAIHQRVAVEKTKVQHGETEDQKRGQPIERVFFWKRKLIGWLQVQCLRLHTTDEYYELPYNKDNIELWQSWPGTLGFETKALW